MADTQGLTNRTTWKQVRNAAVRITSSGRIQPDDVDLVASAVLALDGLGDKVVTLFATTAEPDPISYPRLTTQDLMKRMDSACESIRTGEYLDWTYTVEGRETTLKAFIAENVGEGRVMPYDAFGVDLGRMVGLHVGEALEVGPGGAAGTTVVRRLT